MLKFQFQLNKEAFHAIIVKRGPLRQMPLCIPITEAVQRKVSARKIKNNLTWI